MSLKTSLIRRSSSISNGSSSSRSRLLNSFNYIPSTTTNSTASNAVHLSSSFRPTSQPTSINLTLEPLNDTFKRKNLVLYDNEPIKIGRSINKSTTPSESNGFFDSKVLSRSHAEILFEKSNNVGEKRKNSMEMKVEGKVLIKDLKSSNGTFLNGRKIGVENDEFDAVELNNGDLLEFGIDINNEQDPKTTFRKKNIKFSKLSLSAPAPASSNFNDDLSIYDLIERELNLAKQDSQNLIQMNNMLNDFNDILEDYSINDSNKQDQQHQYELLQNSYQDLHKLYTKSIEEHEEEKQKIIFKFTSQLKEKHEPVKNNEQGQKNNYQQLLLDKEKEYDDLLNKFNLHTKEYNLMKENYNTVIKRISVIGEWVNSNIDNNNLSNLSNNKVEDIVELLKVFDKLEKIIELKKAELEGLEIIKKENNKLNDLIGQKDSKLLELEKMIKEFLNVGRGEINSHHSNDLVEKNRLQTQHYISKYIWKNKNFYSPIENKLNQGEFRLMEGSYEFENVGPVTRVLINSTIAYLKENGIKPKAISNIKNYLQTSENFSTDIHTEEIKVPLFGGTLGAFTFNYFKTYHKNIRINEFMGLDKNRFEEMLNLISQEVENYKTNVKCFRLYAKKKDENVNYQF
ncbi:4482_t:CDS:2 [Entrophospora sp. SA101]|nr:4482_t:CDS:2 [Entrophospora sp. SA101]